ncbi:MAG: branched-chain-amino-acid transaminase [Gammaproteobacteria bacterium]|nr:branched-chain-amino-acid transaminase [Gammaproteobacteria bacterium]
MNTQAVCWINGHIVPADQAQVSVFDHGLLYGDGVFEGLRFYSGKIFRLQEHLQRLEYSARAIALPMPLSAEELSRALHDTVAAFAGDNGYLRLVITRGEGPLGIDPRPCRQPTVFIIADQLSMISDSIRRQGARLIIASTRRLAADGLDPRIKSLNYLNHILARMEANHAQADEAILLNNVGRVAEGTADNIFIAKSGQLLTPPVTEGALQGITRDAILQLAAAAGITHAETPLGPYDLYTADECFLTGTGAELIPVREIDGRPLAQCPGPVFSDLSARFQQLVHAHAIP